MKFTHLSEQEQVMNVIQWRQIIAMFYNKITVNDYMYVHVIPTRFLRSSNEIYWIITTKSNYECPSNDIK